ncbi:MAG TPA: PilZ domain-containing protein [Candidatus Nanoarchaeia archaeon]|nr:PilZ domain-containing protein [Candidatus Nanoarchaeia archaeon]
MFLTSSIEVPASRERRTSPRHATNGMVYRVHEAGTSELGKVRDVSLGGCFVLSDLSVQLSEQMHLKFSIGAEFEIEGTIARTGTGGFAIVFSGQAAEA